MAIHIFSFACFLVAIIANYKKNDKKQVTLSKHIL